MQITEKLYENNSLVKECWAKVLSCNKKDKNYEIVLVAVSKPFMDSHVKLFEAMSLNIINVDLTANSLANFFKTEFFHDKYEEKINNSCAGCNNGSGNVDWLWKWNWNRKKGSFWGKTRDLDEHERGSGYHSEICR